MDDSAHHCEENKDKETECNRTMDGTQQVGDLEHNLKQNDGKQRELSKEVDDKQQMDDSTHHCEENKETKCNRRVDCKQQVGDLKHNLKHNKGTQSELSKRVDNRQQIDDSAYHCDKNKDKETKSNKTVDCKEQVDDLEHNLKQNTGKQCELSKQVDDKQQIADSAHHCEENKEILELTSKDKVISDQLHIKVRGMLSKLQTSDVFCSSSLFEKMLKLLDNWEAVQRRCDKLLDTNVCKVFSCFRTDIMQLKTSVSTFQLQTEQELLYYLSRKQGDIIQEGALDEILGAIEKSPFNENALFSWVNLKENEILNLEKYAKRFQNVEVITKYERIEEIMSVGSFKYITTLQVQSFFNETLQSKMKCYIQNKHTPMGILLKSASMFADYYEANKKDNQNTKFIVWECKEKSDTICPGIFLYSKGENVERKTYEPPSKPLKLQLVKNSHNSIQLTWKKPLFGSRYVSAYELSCLADEHTASQANNENSATSERREILKISNEESEEYSYTFIDLEPAKKYTFKIRSCTEAGNSLFSDEIAEHTRPTCPPGTPQVTEVDMFNVNISWDRPKIIGQNVSIDYYEILVTGFKIKKGQTSSPGTTSSIVSIEPNTDYVFKVFAHCGKHGCSETSNESNIYHKEATLPEIMKAKSLCISGNPKTIPQIYEIGKTEVYVDEANKIRKFAIGESLPLLFPKPEEKVIMIVGATGSGKSTLINGMVNYILGVDWAHSYRFKLIQEATAHDQSKSQTTGVTSYTLIHKEGFRTPYTLTIIDTPGFGDTEGIKRDQIITDQIRQFFTTAGNGGIDHIDAIGFVIQSSLPRLTACQKYIFDSVLALFGKDIARNIFMLLTFADGQRAPVLHSLEKAKLPFEKSFKFNSSALYAEKDPNAGELNFDEMFWKMGNESFRMFLTELSNITPQSLILTKKVLRERQFLQINVENIQNDIKRGLNLLEQLKKEVQVIKSHESDIDKNKNFKYTIEEEKIVTVPLKPGVYTTNCTCCNKTCHENCAISDNDAKAGCISMDDEGNCTICVNCCHWSLHLNHPYKYEVTRVTVEKTADDLKARYETALQKKMSAEQLIDQVLDDFEANQINIIGMTEKVRLCLERLDEIALRPNPLSTTDYIDILIESEKSEGKPGFTERIKQLTDIRKQTECMISLAKNGNDPFAEYKKKIAEEKKNRSDGPWARVEKCLGQLSKTAPKPSSQMINYIDIFIDKENLTKSPGWEQRIVEMQALREEFVEMEHDAELGRYSFIEKLTEKMTKERKSGNSKKFILFDKHVLGPLKSKWKGVTNFFNTIKECKDKGFLMDIPVYGHVP